MPIIRRLRSYFFGQSGPAGTKFSRENIPTEARYRELFGSILFPLEVDDTAKEAEAGHVKISTDAHAIAKNDNQSDGHVRTVLPHQLPGVAIDDGTEASDATTIVGEGISMTGAQKSLGGGLLRLIYKIKASVKRSLEIDGTDIQLVGDVDTPNEGESYMYKNGARTWAIATSIPDIIIDSQTTEFPAAGGAEWEGLGSIEFAPATHLANAGDKIITKWYVQRDAIVTGARRGWDLRIGTLNHGGANNERLLFDHYDYLELTEEKYLITAEITNAGANSYHVYATIKCLTAKPTEEEVKTLAILPITLPATSYIKLWAWNSEATGDMTLLANDAIYLT